MNTSTGANHYKWLTEDNQLFSNATSPSVTEAEVGRYCYNLIAESFAGCIDSADGCGDIIRKEIVFFPSAFSPNGDQRNDVFRPLLLDMDLKAMKDFSFVIVNRYGEVMHKSFNPAEGWDGTWHGVSCDLGTYYYVCKFVTPQGKIYNIRGDVTLIY
jgi:gliding motility-associated-like protein